MKASKDPFHQALSALLADREMSTRQLSRATESAGNRISHVTVSAMLRCELEPSRRAMEAVAAGLMIDPTVFAEYRLEVKRDELNWRHVGLKAALKALGE